MALKLKSAVLATCGLLFAAGEGECPAVLGSYLAMAAGNVTLHDDCDAGGEDAFFDTYFYDSSGTLLNLYGHWTGYDDVCQDRSAPLTLKVFVWNETLEDEIWRTDCSADGSECEAFECNPPCDVDNGWCTVYSSECAMQKFEVEGMFPDEVVQRCDEHFGEWDHRCPAKISQILRDVWHFDAGESCDSGDEWAYVIAGAGTEEDSQLWVGEWLDYDDVCGGAKDPVLSVLPFSLNQTLALQNTTCLVDEDCTSCGKCDTEEGTCFPSYPKDCAIGDGFEVPISYSDASEHCGGLVESDDGDDGDSCVMLPEHIAKEWKARRCLH